jgi:hypothetical protein
VARHHHHEFVPTSRTTKIKKKTDCGSLRGSRPNSPSPCGTRFERTVPRQLRIFRSAIRNPHFAFRIPVCDQGEGAIQIPGNIKTRISSSM